MAGLFKIGLLLIKSKMAFMLLSMLVSLWFYQTMFGWPFSIGFVLLIFVHEMGHYIAAKQRGLKVGAPTFIPFMGAYILLKEQPHNVETEAYVSLAGPLVGTIGSLVVYALGRVDNDPLLLGLSYAGFMINLFNMIPVSPLDGGRIAAVLGPRIWFIGVPILVAFAIYRFSPVLIVIAIAAWPNLKRAWHYDPKDPANAAYYQIEPAQRLFYTVYYMFLTGFLAVMTSTLNDSLRG